MKRLLISVCVLIAFEGYYARGELIPGLGKLPEAFGCEGVVSGTPLTVKILIERLGLSGVSGNEICNGTCDKEGNGKCRDLGRKDAKISNQTSKLDISTDRFFSNVSQLNFDEQLDFFSVRPPAETGISVFLKNFVCDCPNCKDNNKCKIGPHPAESQIRCYKVGSGSSCSKDCTSGEQAYRCLNFFTSEIRANDPVDVLLVYCACCKK